LASARARRYRCRTSFLKILRLKPAQMFAELQPTWKLGLRFLWGPRESFQYTFSRQLDFRWPDLPKNNGYYCDEEFAPNRSVVVTHGA
jgi:tryptophan halogenase